ncbi:5-deoxy-glucuronate isomerase [Methylobacterium soli]|uniref:5-deoxy-glucuronate isomerase n=1 Tax=Methylobacterium soli TaxID=553447 RepID=A0A6L3SWR2_9HYPH|nr:5-deoxy-glucuronate isomerase [Methylobacterium soli]KAB1077402.1 5-deoxy-glucuronate isomerase [Methylobacterium soli]GJE44425.1 5-deoxy-glucuronate isomerase [Methylobacterium soli]
MSRLLVKPRPGPGRVIDVTPASAGWGHVGFAVHELAPGDRADGHDPDRETCLVLVAGTGSVAVDGQALSRIGERQSPFEGSPDSVYVPAGLSWTFVADDTVTLAVCTAPGRTGSRPARRIRPGDVAQESRGTGSNLRYVRNILPEEAEADSLLVVEVITPAGHSSSYPPHKHDRDALPNESLLEETYYFRLNPKQGFAFQRIYTDDRSLDTAMAVEDGDVTLVPRGYHPCAAIHGYDLYYLNVMAGPRRTWKFHNAPEHTWLLHG